MKAKYFLLIGFTIGFSSLFAQSTRDLVNDGVNAYEENKYADAETNFKKGIESNVENFE